MKILFLSAEVAPFVSVGGLSQVMYFLPRALKSRGHDVRIFTPLYGVSKAIEEGNLKADTVNLHVDINKEEDGAFLSCQVKYLPGDAKNVGVYFLENREYYQLRANVFGYSDDHKRFALLSKACIKWLLNQKEKGDKGWWPDVIHCHDWHTSYFIDLVKKTERYSKIFAKTPVLLTVHNFKYQGNWDFKFTPQEDQDDGLSPLASLTSPELQKQNALKRGLLFADAITTVSPTHTIEVLTPEYSEGLNDTLQVVRGKLSGILNGIDNKAFNPETDLFIKKPFSKKTFIKNRPMNKADLQREFSLPIKPLTPLLAYVGRLTSQKGLNLLIEVLPHLFDEQPDLQFVAMGGGDEMYKIALMQLRDKFPDQVALHLIPDFRLPRKIFAGADVVLMPSIFEPGGIVALEALRYGAVPLVRKTGGLEDIVSDFDLATTQGNGFSFRQKTPWALYGAIVKALTVYRQKNFWLKLVANCLSRDFSWDHSAKEYEDWYLHNIKKKNKRYIPISIFRTFIKK